MSNTHHRLTREEEDLLPFDYTDAYYQNVTHLGETFRTYRAIWGPFRVWTDYAPNRTWRIYKPDESEIRETHWEQAYPGIQHIDNSEIRSNQLVGSFQGRDVCWSKSRRQWIYLNNRAVDFLQAEEEQVSRSLDTAQRSIEQSIERLSPRTRTVPGELPDTPTP